MSSIITDEFVRDLITPFGNYDLAYITIVNDGMIQDEYIKPFLNGFYDTYIATPTDYPAIDASIKKAIGYFTGDLVSEQNGQSKTANLGEMANHTNNSNTAKFDKMRGKQLMFIDRGIRLIKSVFEVLKANPEDYPDFELKDVYFSFNFNRFTGIN